MAHQTDSTKNGHITVRLTADHIIVCVLHGYVSEPLVVDSLAQTEHYIQLLRAQNKPVLLLIDASGVSGQSSGARSQAKRLGVMGVQKLAVTGARGPLALVVQYLIKASGTGGYARMFKSGHLARQWLLHDQPQHNGHSLFALRLVCALAAVGIAILALIGWSINNEALKSIFPSLKSMNPMVAVSLIAASATLLLLKRSEVALWRKYVTGCIASWCLIFGGLVLARQFLSIDIPVDALLFTDRLNANNLSGLTAPATAFCFMNLSVMLFAALTGQPKQWHRYAFHGASVLLFFTALGAVIGYTFGNTLDYFAHLLPMPLGAAISLLCINHGLQSINKPLPFFAVSWRATHVYGQAILVFFAIFTITGISWQQTRESITRSITNAAQDTFKIREATINSRIDAYTNALRGFRSFFQASEFVTPDEYRDYFASSQLAQNYPGFSSIVFVRNIPAAQESAFVKEVRMLASPSWPKYQHFGIYPESTATVRYPAVYAQPERNTTNYGFDLGSNATRRIALEKARDTGEVATTGTIDLNAARADSSLPKRYGFFMTIPVYRDTPSKGEPHTVSDRRARIYGFVNAYFEYKVLFGDIFKDEHQNLYYILSNASTGEILYTNGLAASGQSTFQALEQSVSIAGEKVRLSLHVPAEYGLTRAERSQPMLIFVSGMLVAGLAALLLVGQSRRRQQALKLADSMTEDLNNERNRAVATQQKDEAILSSIGDAVFAIDTDERITLFNPSAEHVSGFSAKEALGRPYKEVLHFAYEKNNRISDEFIKKALGGQLASMKNQTILRCKNGSIIPVADSAAPIRNTEGGIQGAIVVFRDVSKEYELDQAKTEFVSLASHQLRTPLSAINWYTELLLSGDAGKVTKSQREYLQEIAGGNKRMIDLVNSLLNVSRLDLGRLTSQPAPTDVAALAGELRKELASGITKKKLAYIEKIDQKLPPVVADPKLLRMIVQNLLSNAIKYTPKGSVTLTLRRAASKDIQAAKRRQDKPYLYMSVADTGYGIPVSQQDKVFEKLFRADNVRVLDVEGTGLGLYIVKEVVEQLGGRVWFDSVEGKGTTFTVVLPFEPPKVTKPPKED